MTVDGYIASGSCGGTVFSFPIGNCICQSNTGGSAPYSFYKITPAGNGTSICYVPPTPAPTAPVCFHESTTIVYAGRSMKLAELATFPECHVPHRPTSSGVRIKAANGGELRLTRDHLVFTSRGLVAAGSLVVGDVLFTSLDEKQTSGVVSVTAEDNQSYFGLNCLENTVLANGFKTSTVGHYHTVPSLWFKYAGRLFGIERASQIGDALATALFKLRILK